MIAVVLLRRTGDNRNTGQPIAKVDSAFEEVFQVTCPLLAMSANPACNVPFRYFRSGRIFVFEANGVWTHRLCP